jgi:hypothetical protein
MRHGLRELVGWVLLVLGLFLFYRCYGLVTVPDRSRILEGWMIALIGIFVFRGGIHIIKVAVAARICQDAVEQPAAGRPLRVSGTAARGLTRALGTPLSEKRR